MRMSDLISRSKLIEEINELLKSPYANQQQFGAERREAIEIVRDLCVKNQPIAYSVDMVAHELSKLKHTDISNCDNWLDKIYGYCKQCDRTMLVDKAIEIVKDGGMCELEEDEIEGVE